MTVIVERGLWFEELEVGATYRHAPGRTVSDADNTLFSVLTMNQQALHLDAHAGAQSAFGSRLVNSLFTMSVVVGLSVNQLTQDTLVANLGFTDVRFPRPVFPGDTIYAATTVVAKRLSASRPGEGVVTLRHLGHNQDSHEIAAIERVTLVRCRPDIA
jgi:acyl dehydratase